MYTCVGTRQSGQLQPCSLSDMFIFIFYYLPPYIHPGRNHNSVPCGEHVHILEDSVSGEQTLAALWRNATSLL